MECMGVASGCGEQEVGVASGSGWNLWVWLLGVVVRRNIVYFLTLLLLYLFFFTAASLPFVHLKNVFVLLEEERRRRIPNRDFLLRAVPT